MADLARRATSVCTKFHRDRLRNALNYDVGYTVTVEKWDLSQFHMGGSELRHRSILETSNALAPKCQIQKL